MNRSLQYAFHGSDAVRTGDTEENPAMQQDAPAVEEDVVQKRPRVNTHQNSGIISLEVVYRHTRQCILDCKYIDNITPDDFQREKRKTTNEETGKEEEDSFHARIMYRNMFPLIEYGVVGKPQVLLGKSIEELWHIPCDLDIIIPAGATRYKKTKEQFIYLSHSLVSPNDQKYGQCQKLCDIANDYLRSLNEEVLNSGDALRFYQRGIDMVPLKNLPMGLNLKLTLATDECAKKYNLAFPRVDF